MPLALISVSHVGTALCMMTANILKALKSKLGGLCSCCKGKKKNKVDPEATPLAETNNSTSEPPKEDDMDAESRAEANVPILLALVLFLIWMGISSVYFWQMSALQSWSPSWAPYNTWYFGDAAYFVFISVLTVGKIFFAENCAFKPTAGAHLNIKVHNLSKFQA